MKRREFLKNTALGMAATVAGSKATAGGEKDSEGNPVRVLCWSELTEPKEVYPDGISGALEEYLKTQPGMSVRTASIHDPDQGLSNQTLD